MKNTPTPDEQPPARAAGDAADGIRGLERELAEQAEVRRQSAETWREAVHDLRGFLGVVKNSITILNQENVSEPMRNEFLTMLRESMASMNAMLNDLMSLASLQADHEHPKAESFDASAVIEELCVELQPIAGARGLLLNALGPATLPVEGDAGRVRRIAHNLVLIGLQSIKRGAVTVSWGECATEVSGQWTLCAQFAGTNDDVIANSTIVRDENESAEEPSGAPERVKQAGGASTQTKPIPTRAPPPGARPPPHLTRVNIARSIVQCLCDLLGAKLEDDAGKANAFVVTFPRHSDASQAHDSQV